MASTAATEPLQTSLVFAPQTLTFADTSHLSPSLLFTSHCPAVAQHPHQQPAQASAAAQVQDASLDPRG